MSALRSRGGDDADQLGADLVKAAAVGFALLMEDAGQFRGDLEVGFRGLLDFDVHHFFE